MQGYARPDDVGLEREHWGGGIAQTECFVCCLRDGRIALLVRGAFLSCGFAWEDFSRAVALAMLAIKQFLVIY